MCTPRISQVAGQKDPLESLLTLPKGYMGDCPVRPGMQPKSTSMHTQIRHTGIVIAHGTQPDHKSKLLTELAITLAAKGAKYRDSGSH